MNVKSKDAIPTTKAKGAKAKNFVDLRVINELDDLAAQFPRA